MPFSALFLPSPIAEAVSDEAWIQAMLDTEAALARAEARAGLIPNSAAEEIAARCHAEHFGSETIMIEARQAGNPAEPLVRALRRSVPQNAARFVHLGATSQDILDTASMLIARTALGMVEDEIEGIGDSLARLAEKYRHTLMPGRTLLQQALPITFGFKAAQWLSGVTRAGTALHRLHGDALAVELGGAAGTLASLGDAGVTVLHELAAELHLAEPAIPWHTERSRIAEIASSLGLTSGALDKIALDIALLAQKEVGEVVESGNGRHGGSSTLPHKQNPVGAVLTRACVREAQAHVEVLMRGMAHEHERAAGTWHSEWQALSGALAYTGGAASWLRETLDNLEVRPERMLENLDETRGLIMAEHVALLLAERMGREEAHDLVRSLSLRVRDEGANLKDILLGDETICSRMSTDEIEEAMDPASYLGSADLFIDRALAMYGAGMRKRWSSPTGSETD